jgi:ABC-type siderophore export system fused ATPase/permease subunit
MPDRIESIPEAHASTFEWIFNAPPQSADTPSWDSFPAWLTQRDSSIYWITGKPGSGKSTLMKYLHGHPQLANLLSVWAHGQDLSKAGFYL